MIYIGLAATFISIVLMVFGIYRWIYIRKHIGRNRLEHFTAQLNDQVVLEQKVVQDTALKSSTSVKSSNIISSSKIYKKLEQRLARGNIYLHPNEFILIVLFWGIVVGGILFIISGSILMLILGVVMITVLSHMYLNSCRQKKIRDFNNQIVDMLALISNGLKAGHSFFQSMGMVAQEMQPPISQEFGRMMKQINMGMSIEDALNEMTKRIESKDFELVVTAILIQRQVGGNLSEVLDNISHTIRERIVLKNQIKVLTSQGRLSGLIISLLAPALAVIIYLMNPGFMIIMLKDPLGIVMIMISILFQIIGIMLIKKIVNIKI